MSTIPDLRDMIFRYQERFPDGHPLKEIAITTIHELGRENPFSINKPAFPIKNFAVKSKKGRYDSLADACTKRNLPLTKIKSEVDTILQKYGLRLL